MDIITYALLNSKKADLINGKVPSEQLPSYVDDIIEVDTYEDLPEIGEQGKIYVVLDTNKTYRWSGSAYIEIGGNSAAFQPMPNEWIDSTAADVVIEIKKDFIPAGSAFVGTVNWSDLPTGLGNAECRVYKLNSKIVLLELNSCDTAPYAWFYNSANPGWQTYGGVGQKTANNGEIFNDYENNKAGTKAFNIISATRISDKEGIYTLDSITGLAIDMWVSVKWNSSHINMGQIKGLGVLDGLEPNQIRVLGPNEFFINTDPQYANTAYLFVTSYPYFPDNNLDYLEFTPSHSELGTIILDNNQHAEGSSTEATLLGSHSEGYNTHAIDRYSHTEGVRTIAYYAAHAEGIDNQSLASGSHTEGHLTIATGGNAHAEGYLTKAYGPNSHAEGYNNVSNNENTHTEGQGNFALAKNSHCQGLGNIIYLQAHGAMAAGQENKIGYEDGVTYGGEYSTVFGNKNHVKGTKTICAGVENKIDAHRNAAFGDGLVVPSTRGYGSFTIGKYNDYQSTLWNDIFVIGNGTEDNVRSNAFVVKGNGQIIAGNEEIANDNKALATKKYVDDKDINNQKLSERKTVISSTSPTNSNYPTEQAVVNYVGNTSELFDSNNNIVEAINTTHSIASGAQRGLGVSNYQTLIEYFNLETTVGTMYPIGQSIYIQTVEVPDLWIISKSDTHVPYTFVSDAQFIEDTSAVGGCQIGYYKFAQLETQKVDLTNYVTNNSLNSTLSSKNINDVQNEQWTFTLSDGSTITKTIKIGN